MTTERDDIDTVSADHPGPDVVEQIEDDNAGELAEPVDEDLVDLSTQPEATV